MLNIAFLADFVLVIQNGSYIVSQKNNVEHLALK